MTALCDPHSGVSAYCSFLFAAAPAAPLYVSRVKRLGPRACRVGGLVRCLVPCRTVPYRVGAHGAGGGSSYTAYVRYVATAARAAAAL